MGAGNVIGNNTLRPKVRDLGNAPAAVFPGQLDARRTGHGRHRGGHDGIGPGVLIAHGRQLSGKLQHIENAGEAVAAVALAADEHIVDPVHHVLPIRGIVLDEVLIGVVHGAGGEDGHLVAQAHKVLGKIVLPGQRVILGRHRIMVDEPNSHKATFYSFITTAKVWKISLMS